MDMTIKLANLYIKSALFKKRMALYPYILHHSCHTPVVSTSTMIRKVLQIHQLCSSKIDVRQKICTLFGQMLDQEFQSKPLTFLFHKEILEAEGDSQIHIVIT